MVQPSPLVLFNRCKSFQTAKRGEVCRIPGCTVSPAAPGTPTPVRLPHAPPETFKEFLLYVYTGKVSALLINILLGGFVCKVY